MYNNKFHAKTKHLIQILLLRIKNNYYWKNIPKIKPNNWIRLRKKILKSQKIATEDKKKK